MRIAFWLAMLCVAVLFCCASTCRGQAKQQNSAQALELRSAAAPAWTDESIEGMSFVFLHHSCGSGFLKQGGMWRLLEEMGLSVFDITYGDGWIGDNTNPDHFPVTFGEHMDEVLSWNLTGTDRHEIVAFKSCYPASNVSSDRMLADYKGYYEKLKPMFAKHPEVLFIAWTAPPLVPGATTAQNAGRKRAFCDWLQEDWAPDEKNIAVFDCFGVLADSDGYLRTEYRKSESDSHPNEAGNIAVAKAFTDQLPDMISRWGE